MLAYYQEYLTAKGEADDRPNKQLFREMRWEPRTSQCGRCSTHFRTYC